MQTRWFWKNWPLDYRAIWYGVLALFIASVLFLWIGYFQGPDAVTDWMVFHQQETRESVSHAFDLGNFEISIPIESYLTFSYFNGSAIHPNLNASYFFLIGLVFGMVLLLTIITTLEKFWYFAGMGLFILFMVSLRLEVLRLFDITGRTVPIIIIVVFVLTTFFFNSIRSSTPFLIRFFTFLILTLLLAVCIHFFAGVDYPFLHMAVAGYLPGLILSVIFILMIAHEIPASFVYITSTGTATSKSLRHFSIISVVYMVNLVLAYMHEKKLIEWDFIYINFFLLLTLSAILGVWGLRHRENLYESMLPFNPSGAYLIIILGCITFLTGGLLVGNHNDPAIKIIRDVIIFSHIGYGGIFLIYIVSNFMVMMADNLNVWKVLYKPTRMPYFTFRFAGLIATMAFVFYSNWKEYAYNGMSGFYNHLGDLYVLLDREALAEAYYQQGRAYGFQNNRSNYVLAQLEVSKNNVKKAYNHYQLANGNRPTEYSLANEGNLFLAERRTFESIASFSKALSKFPNSGPLENNLGFAYSKIHKLDSALFFFDAARNNKQSKEAAEANVFALIGKEYLPVQSDSLLQQFNSTSQLTIGNALAVASLQRQTFTYMVDPLAQKQLDIASATLLNNYLVHNLKKIDTTTLRQVENIIMDSVNLDYQEALKATLAQAYYHQHNVRKALSIMGELGYLSEIMQGKFNYIAGLWALEQGSPELAISSFAFAVQHNYKEARLYNAVALAEARQFTEALAEVDSLLQHRDENLQEIGRQLKKVLSSSVDVNSFNDLEKYQFCRYRIGIRDTILFERILPLFENTDYKATALIEMAERQLDFNRIATAIRYLNLSGTLPVSDVNLAQRVNHLELKILAVLGRTDQLEQKIKGVTFSREQSLEKLLYESLIKEYRGDGERATAGFLLLAHYNPFFEEGVIASAKYFRKQNPEEFTAYNILAEAVQTNTTSYRLWMAYAEEATRVGFDNYALVALEEAESLKRRR
ncbi:MAG: hypothetical protein KF803_02140 [Cyclobacteriaceae bacterium]|nr:hypothetical protein [Cyclobacteriaceae bacterium]